MAQEDPEIIKAVISGDTEAYSELVRRHHVKILSLCTSYLKSRVQAEEVTQEAFLKAYCLLKNFRGDSSFKTWLYRIASNLCIDFLRKERRRPLESWETLKESRLESLEKVLRTRLEPQSVLEQSELVQQALSLLPLDYKEVLVLREIQELSYEEISQTLGCSLDAVKARLRRARKELSEKFKPFLETLEKEKVED